MPTIYSRLHFEMTISNIAGAINNNSVTDTMNDIVKDAGFSSVSTVTDFAIGTSTVAVFVFIVDIFFALATITTTAIITIAVFVVLSPLSLL